MKKMILSGIFVAAIALMAWNFYSSLHNEDLSELAKANIEALARPEKPTEPNFIGGDSGSGNLKDAYVDISINTNPVPNIYDEYYKKMIYQNGKCEKKRMRIPSMDGQCQSN